MGRDWVMHGSNWDVNNVFSCSIIAMEHSMCSTVINLKADYLPGIPLWTKFEDQFGSRDLFGCRGGGSLPLIHPEFQVGRISILECVI